MKITIGILAFIALFFAPTIVEVLPKTVIDLAATLIMLGLILTFTALFLWVGFKK